MFDFLKKLIPHHTPEMPKSPQEEFGQREMQMRNQACDTVGSHSRLIDQTIADTGMGHAQEAAAWANVDQTGWCKDAMKMVPKTPLPGMDVRSSESWSDYFKDFWHQFID